LPLTLGAIVCVSTVLHAVLALRLSAPQSLPDELIYAELAKSLGAGQLPRIRGEVSFEYGLGYPMLLAPIWAIFESSVTAYTGTKVLNAFVFSLTAVPAFFFARIFVRPVLAVTIAAMCVLLPSGLYTGVLLTEVALYPATALAMLALAVAIKRPSPRSQFAALSAVALACLVKTLAATFLVAYVMAILLYSWLVARNRRAFGLRLKVYKTTWSVLALACAGFVLAGLVVAGDPAAALGSYASVAHNFDASSIPWWVALHLSELDLLLAVIPFAATILVTWRGLRSGAAPEAQLYAALTLPAVVALLLAVSAFSSEQQAVEFGYAATEGRIHGRATFLLAPLFLVGLGLCLRCRTVVSGSLLAACAIAALLPALIPIEDFDGNVRIQAQALVPWVVLKDDVPFRLSVVVFCGGLAVAFVYLTRLRAPVWAFVAPVLLVWALLIPTIHVSMTVASEFAQRTSGAEPRDWIDRAVTQSDKVSVLWAEPPGDVHVQKEPRHNVAFVSEFFNRSVGNVFELGAHMPYGLPTVPARIDGSLVVPREDRGASVGSLVLAPCHVKLTGDAIAKSANGEAVLFRLRGPVQARVSRPGSC
jgi:hypothetical protein